MLLTEAVIYLLPVFTKREKKATLAKHIFPASYCWFGGGEGGMSLFWGSRDHTAYWSLLSAMQRALLQLFGITVL